MRIGLVATRGRAFITLASALLLSACQLPTDAVERIPASVVIVGEDQINVSSLGSLVKLSAIVYDQRGVEIPGYPLVWEADAPGVLTALGGSRFRATRNGEARVTARVPAGVPSVTQKSYSSGNLEAFVVVRVEQKVTSLSLTVADPRFWAIGQSKDLLARVLDPAGNAIDEDIQFSWTSEDASVVTVDPFGLARAVGDGTTRIVTSYAGMSASIEVSVSATVPVSACMTYSNSEGRTCTDARLTVRYSRILP